MQSSKSQNSRRIGKLWQFLDVSAIMDQPACCYAWRHRKHIYCVIKDASDANGSKIPTKMVLELGSSAKHWQISKFWGSGKFCYEILTDGGFVHLIQWFGMIFDDLILISNVIVKFLQDKRKYCKRRAKFSADISACLFRVTCNKVSGILTHKNWLFEGLWLSNFMWGFLRERKRNFSLILRLVFSGSRVTKSQVYLYTKIEL